MRFHVNQQRNLINKLDEQLKEIRKCHHQKYLNTKPIINNINKNSCLEQKCELVKEKIMTILKLSLNIKSIVKSQEMKKQNLLERQIHVGNLISRTKFQKKQKFLRKWK